MTVTPDMNPQPTLALDSQKHWPPGHWQELITFNPYLCLEIVVRKNTNE